MVTTPNLTPIEQAVEAHPDDAMIAAPASVWRQLLRAVPADVLASLSVAPTVPA